MPPRPPRDCLWNSPLSAAWTPSGLPGPGWGCGVRVTVSTRVVMLADRPPRRWAQGRGLGGLGGWGGPAWLSGAACAEFGGGGLTVRWYG